MRNPFDGRVTRSKPSKTTDSRWDRAARWLKGVVRESPPPASGTVEAPDPSRIGICCSGGGLRSAAYNLGALQILSGSRILQSASYLTAVSGGSYIAASHAIVRAHSQPRQSRARGPPFSTHP